MFGLAKKAAEDGGRIGLALHRDHVSLAIVKRERERATIQRCEKLPLDPAAGPEAIAAALRAAKLPRLRVSTVLRPEDYQLALVDAPDVPPAELRAAMRWRLKEAIDFRVEDAVIDVFDVPPQNRGGQGRMMYAIAARRSAVANHSAALAGVATFDVVDVPELCLRNLASMLPASVAGVALLHVVGRSATVVLTRGPTFFFARQMELRAAPDAAANATFDSSAIALELQRSLDYYERHFDQPPITRIAIGSCSAEARQLADELRRESGFEVEALDFNSAFDCATAIDAALQDDCLLAVGAALRREQRSL